MKKILRFLLACVLLVLLGAIALFTVLTLTEYRPEDRETVEVIQPSSSAFDDSFDESDGNRPEERDSANLSILSWNIGYAGLSRTSDFFMDGGRGVRTQDKISVGNNLAGIQTKIDALNPDILFLQEIDRNSSRSYHLDETTMFRNYYYRTGSAFANNFKVAFLPYPIPPIGKMDSGIMTLTELPVLSAERIQLPIPFKWPVRTANLKRCLLVERIPVSSLKEMHAAGSLPDDIPQTSENGLEKELVLINLHLEAYDDGEGKEAQTRMLASVMQEEYEKGNYVIAGGDFNQSFSGTDTSMYPLQRGDLWACGLLDESSFSDDFRFYMDNAVPSCRSLDRPYDPDDPNFQYYLIDGFIVSGNVKVEEMRTVDCGFEYSDHNPVYMTFSLD